MESSKNPETTKTDEMITIEGSRAVETSAISPVTLQENQSSIKGTEIDAFAADAPISRQQDEVPAEPEKSHSELANASTIRKITLLALFTVAEFLDAFNNTALFPGIPVISSKLHFQASETIWIISSYQLTFAAFLLVSGRISDVYTPKPAFIAGSLILGITHLMGGFTHQKIALLVMRALGGIGGALTIPTALSLIVQLFPNPKSQARAISVFGSAGSIGTILGLIIGATLVQYAGWPWIFWFVAIVGVGVAVICAFLIPGAKRDKNEDIKFDVPGVGLLTIALILFIFAITSGSIKGWGTAYVLAPLVISLVILVVFLWWEAHTNPDDAVIPPRMWHYRNFGILVTLALLPYLWWATSFVNLTSWWEQYYGWTAISVAVHFLPMAIAGWIISYLTGYLPRWFPHKYIILGGLSLAIIGTVLLPFADAPPRYWQFVFPALVIGTIGLMIIYANSFIAVFAYTPPSVAGTVGAVFNCALQLGSAVGLAAVSGITTSIDKKTSFDLPTTEWGQHRNEITNSMWKQAFKGRAASYWFLLAILSVLTLAVVFFFKVDVVKPDEEQDLKEKDAEGLREKR